jgi:hypothetical protein
MLKSQITFATFELELKKGVWGKGFPSFKAIVRF